MSFNAVWKIAHGGIDANNPVRRAAGARLDVAVKLAGSTNWPLLRPVYLRDRLPLRYSGARHEPPMITRCVRIAGALANGDWSMVRPCDRAVAIEAAKSLNWLTDAREPASTHALVEPSLSPGATFVFDAAFPWMQQARTGLKRGYASAHVPLSMPVLAAEDFPVVLQLPRPEGGIEIRRGDVDWYRPLFAPDSDAPCTLARFAEAIRDGEPWRDSPIHARPLNGVDGHYESEIGLDDYCDPAEPKTRTDRVFHAAAESLVRDRCMGLAAIDGVVWRRIDEPLVVPYLIPSRNEPDRQEDDISNAAIYLTWRAGDMMGIEPQSTLIAPTETYKLGIPVKSSPASWPGACEPLMREMASAWNAALPGSPAPVAENWRRAGDSTPPSAENLAPAALWIEASLHACARRVSGESKRRIATEGMFHAGSLQFAVHADNPAKAKDALAGLRSVFGEENAVERREQEVVGVLAESDIALKRRVASLVTSAERFARDIPSSDRDDVADADLIGSAFAP